MFSGIPSEDLNGESINRLENVMTLSVDVQKSFGDMDIWLEPIDASLFPLSRLTQEVTKSNTQGYLNSYRFRKSYPLAENISDGSVITFTSANPDLPLPDRRYLGLHAACAKIAHASGAAEAINWYMRDLENTNVLAEDGSSTKTLEHALSLGLFAVH